MNTDSFDTTGPDSAENTGRESTDSPDSPEVPVTATGERSTTIEEDEDGGILPTPEPTAGGAPAP